MASKKDFGAIPQVRFNRTKMPLSHGVKTTASVGQLFPVSFVEVLPGDSWKSKMTCVSRISSSFLKPVMDNAFMDVYHFFVPYRLVYDKTERVFGNPNPSAYSDNELEDFPTFSSSQTVSEKTVADHLGLPLGTIPKGVNVMPFRAFALIYDKWFRNENVVDEMYIQKGDFNSFAEELNNAEWSASNYMGKLPRVSKKKDYFTSCLPSTQKGAPVSVNLGVAPVFGNGKPLALYQADGSSYQLGSLSVLDDSSFADKEGNVVAKLKFPANFTDYTDPDVGGMKNKALGIAPKSAFGTTVSDYPLTGLEADLTGQGINVNDLRYAFQLQKMLERDALYGSRINEFYLGHFGVSSPDSRLQIPEYLGGGRIPLNVQQVEQTSESSTDSPLGNLAGYSLSNGFSGFNKGFVEHGYVFTVACIRTTHTYQQGIAKSWFRKNRNDLYDPLFANLGEQPVYQSELFLSGSEQDLRETVFGYNEAWADYRRVPSIVSGEMRSNATNSFDIWHFADKYESAPTLSKAFIEETSVNFDRTLSVPSETADNFLLDFWFENEAIRVMPLYSVPGLIDHH